MARECRIRNIRHRSGRTTRVQSDNDSSPPRSTTRLLALWLLDMRGPSFVKSQTYGSFERHASLRERLLLAAKDDDNFSTRNRASSLIWNAYNGRARPCQRIPLTNSPSKPFIIRRWSGVTHSRDEREEERSQSRLDAQSWRGSVFGGVLL
ncbi:hypothetical protein DFP72DRAFT_1069644 [Ephemerocybe angulata]|uniref:Uncharacterized protein n=1 Tax=Ephemerocybe angulata TaxID=980116 RepID=A0A8H6HVB7_9AGAR|nr:hypothetical protein DFP72DRAFT_1069644 [Tulosesus angulatus]